MIKENKTISLAAEERLKSGSQHAKHLRNEGWLPCVVYNSKGHSNLIKVNRHQFEMLLQHHGGQNVIIDLNIDGKRNRKVLLKALQRNLITDHIIHTDFLEISLKHRVHVTVSLKLAGEPIGVTEQEGILEHLLRSVEVECLPTDIINEIDVDVSKLKIDDSLFVRDIEVDPKLKIITAGDIPIVSVHKPHIVEEVKPEEEEAVAAEGEEAEAVEGAKEIGTAEQPTEKKEEKEVKQAEKAKTQTKEKK